MVLHDPTLEEATPVVTHVAKRPKSEELLLLAGAQPPNAEDHVVQVSHDARELPVSGPSRLVIRCRISGTRESARTKELGDLQRVGRSFRGASSWSDCV